MDKSDVKADGGSDAKNDEEEKDFKLNELKQQKSQSHNSDIS